MTDIYQLKENGTPVYMQTHAKAVDGLIDAMYPIGSIYMSVNSTNPTTIFGGTWERFANGKVVVGVDENDTDFATIEKTGGAKTHSHDRGSIMALIQMSGTTLAAKGGTTSPAWTSTVSLNNAAASSDSVSRTSSVNTQGTTATASSLQPYITAYMWKRIA